MAKFLPVVGEAYTAIESGIMIIGAGLAKMVGEDKAAQELVDKAGEAWEEYTKTNLLAAPVNMFVQTVNGDTKQLNQIQDSFCNAAQDLMDGIPVVGHVKGVVHYAMGDNEKGHRSMESATRTTAVVGVGIATGGLGAGLAVGAAAGIGTGFAYDGTATAIDYAVNGNDAHLHGSIALARADKMNHKQRVGALIGVAGDGLAGVGGNQLGKNIRSGLSGQRDLHNTYRNSEQLRQTGTDHRTATRVTMDAAEKSLKAQKDLSKPTAYATSVVEDSATGQQGVGHSGFYRKQYRIDNFERLGFDSRTRAGRATGYDQPSHLQAKYENVQQVSRRPQAACAEHPAFNNLAGKNPNYNPRNVNTATVYNNIHDINTIKRCENCAQYGDGMGTVATDYIPERTPVPTSGYVRDGYVPGASAAAAAGYASRSVSKGKKQG